MSKKLINDATDSLMGNIYQLYVILDSCRNLVTGEKIYVEKYGDISVSAKSQTETKAFKENLTDSHLNLWKTLANWMDPSFDVAYYKELILRTTQKFGAKAQIKNWAIINSTQKIDILKDIYEKHKSKKGNKSEDLTKHMEKVFDRANESKFIEIINKFIIITNDPRPKDYIDKLQDQIAVHILEKNKESFINALMGKLVKNIVSEGEISYDEYSKYNKELTDVYRNRAITFPKLEINFQENEKNAQKTKLFIKKIQDIHYDDEINDAILNYLQAITLSLTELSKAPVLYEDYKEYLEQLKMKYKYSYRKNCRDLIDISKLEEFSQSFYDSLFAESPLNFSHFQNVPISFRNGCYHILADEVKENVKWLLVK